MLSIVRHGQSLLNAEGRFTGRLDTPLSARGLIEAKSLATRLSQRGAAFDAAFCSTLARAIDTAAIILSAVPCATECVRHPALDERDYGALAGLTEDEAGDRWGHTQVQAWRRGVEDRPPDGESLADTARRMLPYVEATIMPIVLEGGRVLLVSHGNTLRALVMSLEQLSAKEIFGREIGTGELVEYRVEHGSLVRT